MDDEAELGGRLSAYEADLRARLAALGALRDVAARAQTEARLTARELLPEARAAGLSVSEIARLSSLSRRNALEYLPVDPRRARTRALTDPPT